MNIEPASVTLTQGRTQAFHALDANGQPVNAQWTVAPIAGAGTITAANGEYQAPATIAAPVSAVVQATAGQDTATANITLVPPVINLLPDHVRLRAGQSQSFTATMPGAPNAPLTWVISPDGDWNAATHTLTAPNAIAADRTHTVTVSCDQLQASPKTVTVDFVGPKPSMWLVLGIGVYLTAVFAIGLFVIDLWPSAGSNLPDLAKLQSERDQLQKNVDAARANAQAAHAQATAPGTAGGAQIPPTAGQGADPTKAGVNTPGENKAANPADAQKRQTGKETADMAKSGANGTGNTGKGAPQTTPAEADQKVKDAEAVLAAKNAEIAAVGSAARAPVKTRFGEVNREADLLLIAMLCGAIGAFLYGAKSFTAYLGNETFDSSWTAWYLFMPLIGSGLALLFYLVFRGGLLTSASSSDVNPFGIAGLSGLVGMFTKQATNKLDEVFSTMFRSNKDQELKDKLPTGAQQPK